MLLGFTERSNRTAIGVGALRLLQRHLDDLLMDGKRRAVPHPVRCQGRSCMLKANADRPWLGTSQESGLTYNLTPWQGRAVIADLGKGCASNSNRIGEGR